MLNEYSCYQQNNGNANKPELFLQTMLVMVLVLMMMLMRAAFAMMIVFM